MYAWQISKYIDAYCFPEDACDVDKVADIGYETEKGTGVFGEENKSEQTGSSGWFCV